MQPHTTLSYEDVHFRPHQFGYGLALAGLVSLAAVCVALATSYHPGWLLGLFVVIGSGVYLAAHYTTGGLIIRGYDIVLRVGTWATREISQPVWEARPEIRQTFIERMLGAASVSLTIDGEVYTVQVARIKAFNQHITARRLFILGLVDRQALLRITQHSQVPAKEPFLIEER